MLNGTQEHFALHMMTMVTNEAMNSSWLKIPGEEVGVEGVMRSLRQRVFEQQARRLPEAESPVEIAQALWEEMIVDQAKEVNFMIPWHECDIMPDRYVIDWRIPILGPIHAVVRRVINAEIRRYLLPSLRKQSHLNRRLLQYLRDVSEENARLQRQIEEL